MKVDGSAEVARGNKRLVYGMGPLDGLHQHCSSGPKNSAEG